MRLMTWIQYVRQRSHRPPGSQRRFRRGGRWSAIDALEARCLLTAELSGVASTGAAVPLYGESSAFALSSDADIIFAGARTDGINRVQVQYRIENAPVAPTMELGVYRSADGVFDPGADQLLARFPLSGEALDVGSHALLLTVGAWEGQLPLPGMGAPESRLDYDILFVFDHLDEIAESDAHPFNEDNIGPLTGVYHRAGGPVMVLGSPESDVLRVTSPDPLTTQVTFNAHTITFLSADITTVRFRGHAGDDVAYCGTTDDLLLGGPGADELHGGAGSDILTGGPGMDRLFGEDGLDFIYDGGGDDWVASDPFSADGGVVYPAAEGSDVLGATTAEDRLDFSVSPRAVRVDLDAESTQTVDANGNEIRLAGQWEHFTGSRYDDDLRVQPLDLPRALDGGDGTDRIVIDAGGDVAFFDGVGTVTFGAGAPLSLTSFEDIRLINAAARIIDDSDPVGFSHTGFTDAGATDGYAGGYKLSAGGSGNSAIWHFEDLVPGRYAAAATWREGADRANDAPFSYFNGGPEGTLINTIPISQENLADDVSFDGFGWELLCVIDVTGTELTIELGDAADEFVVADAVRIWPLTETIIDNSMPQFLWTGGRLIFDQGGLMGSQRNYNIGPGAGTSEWTTTDLLPPPDFRAGDYFISATWGDVLWGGPASRYRLMNGTDSISVAVDQSIPPNDYNVDGILWEKLAAIRLDDWSDLMVRMHLYDGIWADAVRIDALPHPSMEWFDPATSEWQQVADRHVVEMPDLARDGSGAATSVQRFRIRNRGPGRLDLSSVDVTGAGYTIGLQPASTITADGWTEFTVAFEADHVGTFDGRITLTPSAPFLSPYSISPRVNVMDDTTPPTISAVLPQPGPLIVRDLAIPFVVEATDDLGIRQVDLTIGSQQVTLTRSPYQFDYQLVAGQQPPAALPVAVTVTDVAGNSTTLNDALQLSTADPPEVAFAAPLPYADPFDPSAPLIHLPVIVQPEDALRIVDIDVLINGLPAGSLTAADVEYVMPRPDFNGPAWVSAAVTDVFGTTRVSPPLTLSSQQPLGITAPVNPTAMMHPPGGAVAQFAPVGSLLTPTVQWNPVVAAQSYDLYVRNIDTDVAQQISQSTTSWTPPVPLTPALYRFWVRSVDDAGVRSAWTAPFDYRADTILGSSDQPGVLVLSPPDDTTPLLQVDLSSLHNRILGIEDAGDGVAFELFVRDTTAPQQPDRWVTGLTSTQYEWPEELANDEYRVWSRVSDVAGNRSLWSEPVSLSVNYPPPDPPVVTAPAGTLDVSPPTVQWEAVEYAVSYDVLIRRLDRGQSDVFDNVSDVTTFTPAVILKDGDYAVWVRGRNRFDVAGDWSVVSTFTIDVPTPAGVTALQRVGTTNPPTFSWSSVPGADRYELWISDPAVDNSPVYRRDTITTVVHTLPAALPAGTYRVWVRAINSSDEGGVWSDPLDFEL